MHGGHIGIHFDETGLRGRSPGRPPTVKKIAPNYMNLLLNLVIFCMAAILAAILGKKVYEDAREEERILWGEIVSKYENLIFYQRRFDVWWPYWWTF